jgi:hypothetical protein
VMLNDVKGDKEIETHCLKVTILGLSLELSNIE